MCVFECVVFYWCIYVPFAFVHVRLCICVFEYVWHCVFVYSLLCVFGVVLVVVFVFVHGLCNLCHCVIVYLCVPLCVWVCICVCGEVCYRGHACGSCRCVVSMYICLPLCVSVCL